MSQLFGTDGIRGQANTYPIIPEVALSLGKAIAHVFESSGRGTKRALIGKDTRLSGYMLETALTSGLVSMGMDVFLVGPVPTPTVAQLTRSMNADVGIMLTASHNPFDDNGIKIFDRNGFKLNDATELLVEEHILSRELVSDHIRSDHLGKAYRIDDARGRYIQYAKTAVDSVRLHGVKIVIDCANGAAYQIAPWILKELGAEVIKIHAEPDGYNINNDCGAMHPETVAAEVLAHQADIGISLDGDADRVIFADADGRIVDGDRILGMCAMDYKACGLLAQDTLVVTTMSNMGLHEAMQREGIRVLTTDVGDRHVIEAMRTGGYTLGGEQSGHIIFMNHATTGDGIISALQVLNLMHRSQRPLAALAECMCDYPQQLVSLPVRGKPPLESLPRLNDCIRGCAQALGAEGRLIVRYSGTENKLRLLVEARNADCVTHWINRLTTIVTEDLGA